jgi:hypothetical protein
VTVLLKHVDVVGRYRSVLLPDKTRHITILNSFVVALNLSFIVKFNRALRKPSLPLQTLLLINVERSFHYKNDMHVSAK